jgi:hypothetical protein
MMRGTCVRVRNKGAREAGGREKSGGVGANAET